MKWLCIHFNPSIISIFYVFVVHSGNWDILLKSEIIEQTEIDS